MADVPQPTTPPEAHQGSAQAHVPAPSTPPDAFPGRAPPPSMFDGRNTVEQSESFAERCRASDWVPWEEWYFHMPWEPLDFDPLMALQNGWLPPGSVVGGATYNPWAASAKGKAEGKGKSKGKSKARSHSRSQSRARSQSHGRRSASRQGARGSNDDPSQPVPPGTFPDGSRQPPPPGSVPKGSRGTGPPMGWTIPRGSVGEAYLAKAKAKGTYDPFPDRSVTKGKKGDGKDKGKGYGGKKGEKGKGKDHEDRPPMRARSSDRPRSPSQRRAPKGTSKGKGKGRPNTPTEAAAAAGAKAFMAAPCAQQPPRPAGWTNAVRQSICATCRLPLDPVHTAGWCADCTGQILPNKRNFTCSRCGRRVCSDCCRLNLGLVRVRPAIPVVPVAPATGPQAVPGAAAADPQAVPETPAPATAAAADEAVPPSPELDPWSLVSDTIDEEDL